jgi:regulator of sigma E protease
MSGLSLPLGILEYVLPFLVMLVIIVFVHEYGHYKAARLCGVTVETFSIGFGREIWHRIDRHGTRWRIAAIPLGGYVKFLGDADAASAADHAAYDRLSPEQRKRTLQGAPLKHRAAIVAAGPAANFLLAFLLFSGDAYVNGTRAVGTIAGDILSGSAAEQAGLRVGDRIVAIDGTEIMRFDDLRRIVADRPGDPLSLSIERDGRVMAFTVTPQARRAPGFFSERTIGMVGLRPAATEANIVRTEYSSVESLVYGVAHTGRLIRDNVAGFAMLLIGAGSMEDLAGPFTLAQLSGDTLREGIGTFIRFVAVISVAIGFVNLLPVPILDGGHLMFHAMEAVRGKPIGEKAQELSFRIGFAIIMGLMALGIASDILRKFPI